MSPASMAGQRAVRSTFHIAAGCGINDARGEARPTPMRAWCLQVQGHACAGQRGNRALRSCMGRMEL